MSTYRGIDYSGPSSSVNRDSDTGIRYGVVSCHSLNPDVIYDAQEMDYGDPTCPECGGDAVDAATIDAEWNEGGDYACARCENTFWSESAFPDEPCGWSMDDGEYKVINCLGNDAMVINSPYYTFAQFCSPCVPGTGNLDNPCEDGAKSYCFGHDWFEGGVAPYPVYRVTDGARVMPDAEAVPERVQAGNLNLE